MEDFDDASIESYAMKPKKFLSPLVDEYREFMELFKFFLPNGGPYGFVDVAEGKIDCYFARKQPFVDIFSGIMVAEKAGAVVEERNADDLVKNMVERYYESRGLPTAVEVVRPGGSSGVMPI